MLIQLKKGQIRRWGINKLDDGYIDALLADRVIDRNEKARARRKAKKPVNVKTKIEEPPQVRTVKKEKKKTANKNTKAHIKEVIDRIPLGEFIVLEDNVIINMGDGYTIVNTSLISDDELMDIDWSEPFTYSDYIIGDSLSETKAIDMVYDIYKKKKKIKLLGN